MISNNAAVLSRRTFFVGLKASAKARDHIVARAMPLKGLDGKKNKIY